MWYEILPSFGIVVGLLAIPTYGNLFINYAFRNRKTVGRNWEADHRDFMMYMRDQRITGSEYVPRGLESLPDDPSL